MSRRRLIDGLALVERKLVQSAPRKHGNLPL
jgi:hypothetical protein